MKLLAIVEETSTGYSAYLPDLPGCIATGRTRAEVERTIRDAAQFHVEVLHDDGLEVPTPHTYATVVEIAA